MIGAKASDRLNRPTGEADAPNLPNRLCRAHFLAGRLRALTTPPAPEFLDKRLWAALVDRAHTVADRLDDMADAAEAVAYDG